MATLANLNARARRLISDGRVYYSQPTDRLEAVIRDAMRHWKTCRPGESPRPWGEGANEDFASVVGEVRCELYGIPLPWEVLAAYTREPREYFAAAWRAVSPWWSLYATGAQQLVAWLVARRKAGLPDYQIQKMDGRDLCRDVSTWHEFSPHGATVRECHRIAAWDWRVLGDLPDSMTGRPRVDYALAAAAAVGRIRYLRMRFQWLSHGEMTALSRRPHRLAVATIVWYALLGCFEAAEEVAAQSGRLRSDDELASQRSVVTLLAENRWAFPRETGILERGSIRVALVDGRPVPHGVLVHPERQTLAAIKGETNPEIRRVRIERFAGANASPTAGWQRYVAELDADVVDARMNDTEGTREILVAAGDDRLLLCTCKTGRVFALPVPWHITTCRHAQDWLAGEESMPRGVPPLNVIGAS